jgi:6-pyruvoyltetrahydropterin/6-carboxytetrahydropterin synthase
MYTIETKLQSFNAAHRLQGKYAGKCRHLHGHEYSVTITLQAKQLNESGFVIDFSEIQKLCDTWIQNNLDHCVILDKNDTVLLKFLQQEKQKYYIIPAGNTSAENIAEHIFIELNKLLNKPKLIKVIVAESTNSQAVYEQ